MPKKKKVYLKSARNITDRRKGSHNSHGTPRYFYDWLNLRFNFTIDVCASAFNHKHWNYYSLDRGEDSLQLPWTGSAFCNPPYGNRIPVFMKKGVAEAKEGNNVVFLVPAKSDTKWWHKFAWRATEIIEIEGRLQFEGNKWPAPFPSCVIIFEPGKLDLPDGPKRTREKLSYIKELMNRIYSEEKVVILRPLD